MEEPVCFPCKDKKLYGVLHIPDGMTEPTTIVLVVTGGPQVRSGPHRLYVDLSRFLCAHNWPSLRFDYEGMGDSEGDFVGYQNLAPSITAAIQFLQKRFGREIKFIFWSLCDGATAVAMHAATHKEHVNGLILCNPFIITDNGEAHSTIKHYYGKRIFDKVFWRKLFRFELDFKDSLKGLWVNINKAFLNKKYFNNLVQHNLPDVIVHCLHDFPKPIRIILSTDDIVAANFQDEIKKNGILEEDYKEKKIINCFIQGADHTFTDYVIRIKLFSTVVKAIHDILALQ